jgi:hypothetical protein
VDADALAPVHRVASVKLPWVPRALYEQALVVSAQFLREKQIAEDRLYAAWKDGFTVPPRESVVPKEPTILRILPEKLHAEVNNWEDSGTRADLEREARRLHFDLGFTEERVLELWKARNGGGEAE